MRGLHTPPVYPTLAHPIQRAEDSSTIQTVEYNLEHNLQVPGVSWYPIPGRVTSNVARPMVSWARSAYGPEYLIGYLYQHRLPQGILNPHAEVGVCL